MCKIQAFGLLVVTLLLFSQESSGADEKRIHVLTTAMGGISTLSNSTVTQLNRTYRIPLNIPENCLMNALACFVERLGRMQDPLKLMNDQRNEKLVGDINTNIQSYMEKTLDRDIKPKEMNAMCSQCNFRQELKTIPIVLEDLLNLLQRVTAKL